jgi:hypothetical protein
MQLCLIVAMIAVHIMLIPLHHYAHLMYPAYLFFLCNKHGISGIAADVSESTSESRRASGIIDARNGIIYNKRLAFTQHLHITYIRRG